MVGKAMIQLSDLISIKFLDKSDLHDIHKRQRFVLFVSEQGSLSLQRFLKIQIMIDKFMFCTYLVMVDV